jgi:hypothetical protein
MNHAIHEHQNDRLIGNRMADARRVAARPPSIAPLIYIFPSRAPLSSPPLSLSLYLLR